MAGECNHATVEDVAVRLGRTLDETEQVVCQALLDDAYVIIESISPTAAEIQKKVIACRMVLRAIEASRNVGVPIGATQGSMSGLGYSESWTISSGSVGELYLTKLERQLLGASNAVGSYSPVEQLATPEVPT